MALVKSSPASSAGESATASLTSSHCVPGRLSLKRRANECISKGAVKRLAQKFELLERKNDKENLKSKHRSTIKPSAGLSVPLNRLHRWTVLRRCLGCVWKDAVALDKVDQLIKQGFREGYYETVARFVVEYGRILNEQDPIQTSELDLDAMEQT